MPQHRSTVIVALSLILAACGDVVDAPPPRPLVPLVESILVGGDSLATFRIRLIRAESDTPAPADPGSVALRLTGPSGASAPLTPHPDSAGQFVAALPIVAGGRHRLDGIVAGIGIRAETTVPREFTIAAPSEDTLVLDGDGPSALVPFRWTLEGATVVLADSALFPPGYPVTRSTGGQLLVLSRPAGSTGPTIRLWAMNLDAERYLFGNPASVTNVEGGFGVLGAATLRRRVVRWQ